MKTQVILLFLSLIGSCLSICQFSDRRSYELTWVVDNKDVVHFQLTFANFPLTLNAYTGVAFGRSMLSGLDTILVKVINGRIVVTDEYVQGYAPSFPDRAQDVTLTQSQFTQGVLRVRFSRPAAAMEPVVDHSLNGCTEWQFITGPGIVHDARGRVGKHSRSPVSQVVCLDQCRL